MIQFLQLIHSQFSVFASKNHDFCTAEYTCFCASMTQPRMERYASSDCRSTGRLSFLIISSITTSFQFAPQCGALVLQTCYPNIFSSPLTIFSTSPAVLYFPSEHRMHFSGTIFYEIELQRTDIQKIFTSTWN